MQQKNKNTSKISVVIRKRPLSRKELSRNEKDIIRTKGETGVMISEFK